MFKEETDLIWDKPHFINSEKIGFGYYGKLDFSRLVIDSNLPDSVDYIFTKEIEKDTIYIWLTKNSFDSLNFNLIEKDTIKLTTVKFDRKESLVRKDERDYKKGSNNRILVATKWKPKRNIIKTTEDILSYWRYSKNND